jgi:tetratricopeptide (TPR) repeat protein
VREQLPQAPRTGWAPLVGLPALVLACYVSGINNTYIHWDDAFFIADNPALHDPSGLATIWTPNADPVRKFYPLTYTLYWLGFRLWGALPVGYLAMNVALHAAASVLVFTLARRLGLGSAAAWLAAGVFAVHPMHVVSVAWLASTKNVLSTALALAALNAYVVFRGRARPGAYAAFLLLMLAALLSKSAVITLVASLGLLDWLVLRRRSPRAMLALVPVLAVAAVLAAVTASEEWSEGSKTHAEPWPLRPLHAAWALLFYLRQFYWPLELHVLYPKWDIALTWQWLTPLALLVIAAALLAWQRRRVGGLPLWCLAHFAVSLAPVIGLLEFGYLRYAPVSDHFIHLGSVGLALLAGVALDRLLAARPDLVAALKGVSVACVVGLSVLTFLRVPTYRDGVTFWSRAAADSPASRLAREALARRLTVQQQHERALEIWPLLVGDDPDDAGLRVAYGAALVGVRRFSDAIEQFAAAARLDPNNFDAHLNLGNVLMQRGRPAAALPHLHDALNVAPNRWEPHALLAEAHAQLGNLAEAVVQTREVARLRPREIDPLLALARLARAAGQPAAAIDAYREVLRRAPGRADAECALAFVLATTSDPTLRDPDEALRLAQNAVSRSHRAKADHLLALAAAQAAAGQSAEAMQAAEEAARLGPSLDLVSSAGELQRVLGRLRSGQAIHQP